MSNRFHNKWHRTNHHSYQDPSNPDSGRDPIASSEYPFKGEFVLSGQLSAISPWDFYSIDTNNILAQRVDSDNIFVSNTITADHIDVNYIDVIISETSGFNVIGSDFTKNIPTTVPTTNILMLSGVGVSATSWASFNSMLVQNLSAASAITAPSVTIIGCLSTDCIQSTDGSPINMASIITNNISATDANIPTVNTNIINSLNSGSVNIQPTVVTTTISALNVYGTNYYGITSDNLQVTIREGWKPGVTTMYEPQFSVYKSNLDNNTNYPSLTSDTMIIVRLAALDYRSYGEIEGVVNGTVIAKSRVGNPGLIPNANVEHALQTGLWIDNEQTFTFVAPSGQSWQVNTLSGYYNAGTLEANVSAWITIHDQNTREMLFAGDTFTMENIIADNIYAQNVNTEILSATNIIYAPNGNSNEWGAGYISGAILPQLDARYVNITGDIMTGGLTAGGNIDLSGWSLINIGNNSLSFQSGASIKSKINIHPDGYDGYAGVVLLDTVVEGDINNIAYGIYSHAEGANTKALGNVSHTEGSGTIANGIGSHAEGLQCRVGNWNGTNGDYAHAEGELTVAEGYGSHVEGYACSAVGNYSHAAGSNSVAAHANTYIWSNNGASTTSASQFFVSADNGVVLGNSVDIYGNLDMNGGSITNIASGTLSFIGGQSISVNNNNITFSSSISSPNTSNWNTAYTRTSGSLANPVFTSAFQFDQDKVYQPYLLTSPITCVVLSADSYIGKTIMAEISGPSTITFASNFKKLSTISYSTTATNYMYFNYISNNKVLYTISQEQI